MRYRNPPGRHGRQSSQTFDRKSEAHIFAKLLDVLGPQGALDHVIEGRADVPTLDRLAIDHIEHLWGIEPGSRLSYSRL